ncbi:MAG TPA: phage major capsid protein [Edaphobacter sp.]|nr:phage major capsid protein [Edaphobacter sp.]
METKAVVEVLDGIKSSVESLVSQQKAIQTQVDSLDLQNHDRLGNVSMTPGFVEHLKTHEGFQRLLHDRRGSAIITLSGKDAEQILQRKAVITSTGQGSQTTGVLPIDRDRGITAEPRQELTVRDALTARPTSMGMVDFVRVSTPLGIASPQVEGAAKAENALAFTSASERVKTIATWIPASKNILDDFEELASFLETSLTFYVNLAEEQQILGGDNTGENLHGILGQATPFNPSLLGSGSYSRIDIVGRAVQQLTSAKELTPSFIVLNPNDWWNIRLTKDTLGRFLIGDPQTTANAMLFDLLVIPTTSISAGTFLVGSGNPAAAEIRDRMEIQYEVSTEHADYFTKNLVACRAEKRMCLVVKRAASFLTGTFTSSPA